MDCSESGFFVGSPDRSLPPLHGSTNPHGHQLHHCHRFSITAERVPIAAIHLCAHRFKVIPSSTCSRSQLSERCWIRCLPESTVLTVRPNRALHRTNTNNSRIRILFSPNLHHDTQNIVSVLVLSPINSQHLV